VHAFFLHKKAEPPEDLGPVRKSVPIPSCRSAPFAAQHEAQLELTALLKIP
jgi:hypothetical protein